MALSDYGFVGNDIIPNTPIEKVITGFFLAINKVYRGVFQNDNGNLLNFLNSVGTRHFFIDNSSYDYLRVGERAMYYDSYYSQNNVFKRFCYLNETTGEFILFDKNNDNAMLLERNTILQDAVAQLIDSGFQTSILPFYYYNNGYLTAVEFESFYRVFAYPFFKDYFIQRIKYLSLLRIYTEYRAYNFYSNHLIFERSKEGVGADNDVTIAYNNIVFVYRMYNGGNAYYLNVEIHKNTYSNDIYYYIASVIKNTYIPKRIVDNFILTYNDINIYNKSGVWQFSSNNIMGENGVLINGKWNKLDMSTVYSITYLNSNDEEITEDCYKIDYFDFNNFAQQQFNKLNNIDKETIGSSTYYCEWYQTDANSYMTTLSDCFDFSDI